MLAQARPKDVGPLLVIWGACMLVLVSSNDLGSGLLYFGIFLAMLYIATARLSFVLVGLGLFLAGGYFAYEKIGHVHERVMIWLHPWTSDKVFCPSTGGLALRQDCESYQLVQVALLDRERRLRRRRPRQGHVHDARRPRVDPVREHATSSTRRSRRSSA